MEFGESGSMMDDDEVYGAAMDCGGGHQSQGHGHGFGQQQVPPPPPPPPQGGRQWPFAPQSGSTSGSQGLFAFSNSPKPPMPEPMTKTDDETDIVKIPMKGSVWLGGYTVVINSPGSPYHDTEAIMYRVSATQHRTRYFDGTEELCDDSDYTITRPRPHIAVKEKPDRDVDDLEALMKGSSIK